MSERMHQIVDALADTLEDGDAFLVWCTDNTIHVEEYSGDDSSGRLSSLQRSHPDLYGYLASANAQISDATGCGWMVFALILAVAGCAGIYQFLPNLRPGWWWVMPLYVAVIFYVWIQVCQWCEAAVYRRHAQELRSQIDSAGLSRLKVLALIEGDENLNFVSQWLKRDVQPTFH